MNDLVTIQNDAPVTTTLAIAEGVKLEHKTVIQLTRKYQDDMEVFGRVTFEMLPFDTKGGLQKREVAILNERQATLLLTYMRNSEIVRDFKKRLVQKFYEMSEQVKEKQKNLLPEELLVQQAQMLLDQRRELLRLDAQQKAIEDKVEKTNKRLDQIETGIDHFTIIGYARNFLKVALPLSEAAKYGKAATKLCNDMGILMGQVPDPRFGQVNTYPKSVLDNVIGGVH